MLRWAKSRRNYRTTVTSNIEVGTGFRAGNNSIVWAPRKLTLGNNVHLGSNVRIEVDGTIGDSVLIANSAGIVGRTDHSTAEVGVPITETDWVGRSPARLSQPVAIGSDVWIGYGAVVLSGVSIGDSTVIGAGAVVTRDIPANSIAVGNPARVIGRRFDEASFAAHWAKLTSLGYTRNSEL
ncbi:DapH/DapD/GlmU-related protein [Pseudarthrobacter sp. CC12]|uniref:acyltransferase n=1 Tax=Pseudarthrobacter sp. CC12 TaxID=3029193 RepID=UPI003263D9C2